MDTQESMGPDGNMDYLARSPNYARLADEVREGASRGADVTYDVEQAIEALGVGPFQYGLLALTGMCWTAESMEMLLLSFIKAPLQCAWDISDAQAALITTAVGIGMLIGAFSWGIMGDVYGRRATFMISTAFTFFFGIASAFSVNYPMMVVARGIVGIGIGGVPISFSVLMEFLPAAHRGTWAMGLALFWSLGAVFESTVAMLVVPTLGWRWLIGLSSIPLGLVLILSFWLKESPQWLISKGMVAKAEEALGSVSRFNSKALPPGRLVLAGEKDGGDNSEHSSTGFKQAAGLLKPGARSLAIKVAYAWFAVAFAYYGLVMVQPESISKENTGQRCSYAVNECSRLVGEDACNNNLICSWNATESVKGKCLPRGVVREDDSSPADTPLACHRQLTKSDYLSTLWASVGEVPGVLVAFVLVDVIGRRPLLGYMFGLTAITFVLLIGCFGRMVETLIFFGARANSTGAFQGIYLFTNEIYPASIRSSAMGTASSVARLGLIATPFVAQYLANINYSLAMWIYFAISALAVAAVYFIPIETTNRPLTLSMDELVRTLQNSRIKSDQSQEPTFAKDPNVLWIVRLFRWDARVDGEAT